MILVIRHAQKEYDGKLTDEGSIQAQKLRNTLRIMGISRAFVAPNERAEQTAKLAGLEIISHLSALGIPNGYEEYLNTVVLNRMLDQPGEAWQKSFTKAVLDDPLYRTVFSKWGENLARRVKKVATDQLSITLIGSSPLIELCFLSLVNSKDWRDFPRCRELEGFIFDKQKAEFFIHR